MAYTGLQHLVIKQNRPTTFSNTIEPMFWHSKIPFKLTLSLISVGWEFEYLNATLQLLYIDPEVISHNALEQPNDDLPDWFSSAIRPTKEYTSCFKQIEKADEELIFLIDKERKLDKRSLHLIAGRIAEQFGGIVPNEGEEELHTALSCSGRLNKQTRCCNIFEGLERVILG